MNKYKEALETLKYEVFEEGHCSYLENEISVAIEVLEKAIPKKVSKKVDRLRYNHYFCNSCSAYLGSEFLPKGNYCPTCGQKIDWSEEDVD